jgi:hypothetical protein
LQKVSFVSLVSGSSAVYPAGISSSAGSALMSCADVSCAYARSADGGWLDDASGVVSDVDEAVGLVTCEVGADAARPGEFEPQAARTTTAANRTAIRTTVLIGDVMWSHHA